MTSLLVCNVARTSDAPRHARGQVRELCVGRASDDMLDDAQLVVSELVTNALVHGAGVIVLQVELGVLGVILSVGDDGPPLAAATPPDLGSETGRGLAIVAALSTSWGVRPSVGGGKVVWSVVSAGPVAP